MKRSFCATKKLTILARKWEVLDWKLTTWMQWIEKNIISEQQKWIDCSKGFVWDERGYTLISTRLPLTGAPLMSILSQDGILGTNYVWLILDNYATFWKCQIGNYTRRRYPSSVALIFCSQFDHKSRNSGVKKHSTKRYKELHRLHYSTKNSNSCCKPETNRGSELWLVDN